MKSEGHRLLYVTVTAIFLTTALFVFMGSQIACDLTFCVHTGSVETVTLSSATLYSGVTASPSNPAQASISFALNNPGSTTFISSFYLRVDGSSASTTTGAFTLVNFTQTWQTATNSTSPIDFSVDNPINRLAPGSLTSFTFYPRTPTGTSIAKGNTFYYEIDFTNGQSVSGSLISQ